MIGQIEEISRRLKIPALFPVFGIYYAQSLDEPDEYYGFAVQAKHLIKGRRDRHYAFYEEIDYKRVLEEKEMENSFSKAMEDEEFEIWYQPKFSAQKGEATGAEALVRWRKSNGSMLLPGRFIPLLDDFGSGYSSLASLNTLHFDTLKLDKSLIDFITAEGVETENQLAFLKTLCCDDIQGYYFSKPLSMEEYGKNIINVGSFSDC